MKYSDFWKKLEYYGKGRRMMTLRGCDYKFVMSTLMRRARLLLWLHSWSAGAPVHLTAEVWLQRWGDFVSQVIGIAFFTAASLVLASTLRAMWRRTTGSIRTA